MNKKIATLLSMAMIVGSMSAQRLFEYLDRGVVAVRSGNKAFVSWRYLATDNAETTYNVYRTTDGVTSKLNNTPLSGGTNYTDSTVDLTKDNVYEVRAVNNDVEAKSQGKFTLTANKGTGAYYTVPIKPGVSEAEQSVHFVWVGDFDSDGAYDFLIDRPAQNHQSLEAYKNDGTYLYTIDLGYNSENKNNISPGASTIDVGMWDGVTVYDIDCDGKAEILLRVADGVSFGDGTKYTNSTANAQAIAVIDGMTGKLKATAPVPTDYIKIGPMACMMEIGYLDGKTPSLICWMKNRNADKSFNSLMIAYHYENGKFVQQWKSNAVGPEAHQIRVADVDYDGKDEVLHMGYALNGDGKVRYTMPEVVHGDRWYVGKFAKDDKVMMGYGIQQKNTTNGLLEYGYNASTGKLLWGLYDPDPANAGDVARGNIGDIDPRSEGYEVWSFQGIKSHKTGKLVVDGQSSTYPYPVYRLFWDGDVLAESYNDGKIEKWNYENQRVDRAATTWKIYSASGSERGVGMFHGDIIGDWREESILVNYATNELVIYTTDIPTDERIYCLAQNPCYRNHMTAKGYVQTGTLDYYLGYGMDTPPMPNIEIIGGDRSPKPASISRGRGNRGQTINLGDPIDRMVFNFANCDGIEVVGSLPPGVTTSTNKETGKFTIEGTPTEAGIFSYTLNSIGGEPDVTGVAGGTITVVDPNAESSGLETDASSFSYFVSDGLFTLNFTNEDRHNINISAIDGRVLNPIVSEMSEVRIMLRSGVYIVNIDNERTIKVRIK